MLHLDPHTLSIPLGDTVLVTGTTGYLGSHVADQTLAAGYRVRGLVRSLQKSQWLQETFDDKYGPGKFERVEVADPLQQGAYEPAVKDVSGIIHVATVMPMSHEPDPYTAQVTSLTLNALEAAAKEPSVRRVVITSSSFAAASPAPNTERTVTETSWNNEVICQAYKAPYTPDNLMNVYGASKMSAERAAWEWVAKYKPPFVLNAVLPNTNFGPPVSRRHQGFGSTDTMIKQVFEGETAPMHEDPPQYFVDVRDTASLHVIALATTRVQDERLFAFAEPYNWNVVLQILRELYPGRREKFPADLPGLGEDVSRYPVDRATELIKAYGGRRENGWISLRESVRDTLADQL